MRTSIQKRLTTAFIGLAVGPLLLVGTLLTWQSVTVLRQQAIGLQLETAKRISCQVTAFF